MYSFTGVQVLICLNCPTSQSSKQPINCESGGQVLSWLFGLIQEVIHGLDMFEYFERGAVGAG